MSNENEYLKLLKDLMDAQQQHCYLLQRLMSIDAEIKALSKEFKEHDEAMQSKSNDEKTKEDYNKYFEFNNKQKVLCEILEMHNKLQNKMERRTKELQKRLEQYYKRHGIDVPDSLKKKM